MNSVEEINILIISNMNKLGHNFIANTNNSNDGSFICLNCKCEASYYLDLDYNNINKYCQRIDKVWRPLLSCNENIIKNIIE